MLHHRPAPTLPHAHHIEPAHVPTPAEPRQPARGHPRQDHAFAGGYRLRGRAAAGGSATLHFDEGNHPVAPDHEVHIVATEAEAVRFDAPTAGSEVGESG